MADSLPLIPEKCSRVCTDVKPVLRGVFQKLDILPPLATEGKDKRADWGSGDTQKDDKWIEQLKTECNEILTKEDELKQQYARRLARDPLPNIYKLHDKKQPPSQTKRETFRTCRHHHTTKEEIEEKWNQEALKLEMIQRSALEKKNKAMKIQRHDLMPTIEQNADAEEKLWIKNILNRSSGDLSIGEVKGSRIHLPITLTSDNYTEQSLSLGELLVRPPPPPSPMPPIQQLPGYIICIPPRLDFVNFTVGQQHTKSIRLVNVSSFEVRLSVRPPERRELDIEIVGQRGLTVTSGADTEFRINFRPRDVRVLHDELMVRVSVGRSLLIPIACYMQPPLLTILVPSVSSSLLYCTPDEGGERMVGRGSDVIEMGTRLLGDVHSVELLFHCDADHVAFFLLTEDAWLSFTLEELSVTGSMVAPPFVVSPAWWRGGGEVRARAWCRATRAGLQVTALRLLASTAVVRPLHLLADSLYYKHDHVTIQAHERNYDILSDDDPACQFYVHLGTAFPARSLSATVQLINRSPVTYSFYWSIRPWGVCSCWDEFVEDQFASEEDSEEFCIGAKDRIQKKRAGTLSLGPLEQSTRVHVEPARGSIAPRSNVALHVRAPNAGGEVGTKRAVLMLILTDIPKESFSKDFDPMIVRTTTVNSDSIPGVKSWSREVCEVVCAQMEVWWEVAPVRFVVDPPILPIIHSRRVDTVALSLRATQLFGSECVPGKWEMATHVVPGASYAVLSPATSHQVQLTYNLPVLPNDYPETDIITLKASSNEWQFSCTVTRSCATRHPALVTPRAPLGVVRPGADMSAAVKVVNDTHQHICWWATAYRWLREREPVKLCVGRLQCAKCGERECSCGLLSPTRDSLSPGEDKDIAYKVVAPDDDGCVATLIQVRRTGADVAHVWGAAGSAARASLVTYRVLAPRLALRALPCCTRAECSCPSHQLDPGAGPAAGVSTRGTAVLRPCAPLTLSRRSRYKLRFTNFTPIPTRVKWDTHLENDVLKVSFYPNEFDIGEYGNVEIMVVLEAMKVTGRRVFVVRAVVEHAHKPLYLLIDAAITGLEVVCEIPIGGEENTDAKIILKMIQREEFPWEVGRPKPSTPDEIFAEFDRIRADKVCRCKYSMEYIPPPPPRPAPPRSELDEPPPTEIVWEPPPLTAVCECFHKKLPMVPEHEETFCLQFKHLPLYTVRSRRITLRNVSSLPAQWSAAVRRWPRAHNRGLDKDDWARDVCSPGVALQCRPVAGRLEAREVLNLQLQVYADCWGLYHDQLLIHVENLPPIVIEVWIEAVGSPLLFALTVSDAEAVPVVWFSSSDPQRIVRVKNTSRSALTVYPYIAKEHEYLQNELPFRLYLRFFDVPPRKCPCVTEYEAFLESGVGENSVHTSFSTLTEEVDTMMELCLTADHGIQSNEFYEVSPSEATIAAGTWHEWRVNLLPGNSDELAPPHVLVLRSFPIDYFGQHWYRGPVADGVAQLRQAANTSSLRLSCQEIIVHLCALDLPAHDVMRVRKRFNISNVGSLRTVVQALVTAPWKVAEGTEEGGTCGAACCRGVSRKAVRKGGAAIDLLPRTSIEMCVEVMIRTESVWPDSTATSCSAGRWCGSKEASFSGGASGLCRPGRPCDAAAPCLAPHYPTLTRSVTNLIFHDNDNELLTLPLVLELEFPVICVEPPLINFGFVTDGDTRKTYFTVAHSSRKETLELVTDWIGPEEFRLWPRHLTVAPGETHRLYMQYTAKWRSAPVEGIARVSVAGGGGGWCRGAGRARAHPARDLGAARPVHDHTDDEHLLPPDLPGIGTRLQ